MNVNFDEKVRLLNLKRNSWYDKLRDFIGVIKPKWAFGYASDMYYGHALEANLLEASLDYPQDLMKAAPGLTIDLEKATVEGSFLSKQSKLNRLYNALLRDKSDIAEFQKAIFHEEIGLDDAEIQKIALTFIDNLSQSCENIDGVVNCDLSIVDLSGNEIIERQLVLGTPCADTSLKLSLRVPIVFISLLSKGKIEMGAIAYGTELLHLCGRIRSDD